MDDLNLGEKASRFASGIELVLWIALAGVWGLVVFAVIEETDLSKGSAPAPQIADDMIEAEALREVARSGDFQFWLQPTSDFEGGLWSRNGHMVALGAKRGDWIELALPDFPPGFYRLELFLTRAPDYGIVSFELNRAALGGRVDLWSEQSVVPSGSVDLGAVRILEDNTLRIEVVDTNAASRYPHFQFAIDGLTVRSVTDPGDAE